MRAVLTPDQWASLMERISAQSTEGGGWWVESACLLDDDREALLDALEDLAEQYSQVAGEDWHRHAPLVQAQSAIDKARGRG